MLKLNAQQVLIAQRLNNELAKGLGFESLPEINKYTKDTEESSKLLLAHYRRMKKTAEFVEKGKVEFPTDPNQTARKSSKSETEGADS